MTRTIKLHWKAFKRFDAACSEFGACNCIYAVWGWGGSQVLYIGQTTNLRMRYAGIVDALLAECTMLARKIKGHWDGLRQLIDALPNTIVDAEYRRQLLEVLPPTDDQAHLFVARVDRDQPLNARAIEDELLNRTLPVFNQRGISKSHSGRKIGYPDPDIVFLHDGDASFASFLNNIELGMH